MVQFKRRGLNSIRNISYELFLSSVLLMYAVKDKQTSPTGVAGWGHVPIGYTARIQKSLGPGFTNYTFEVKK